MIKKAFTLLEVLVAIVLIGIASCLISFRMVRAVQKKKFHSQIERLKNRLVVSQKLAVVSQSDWTCTLQKQEKGWLFEAKCDEIRHKTLPSLQLDEIEVLLNQKRVEKLIFNFFATGHVHPSGSLAFVQGQEKIEWKSSEIFHESEGKILGPIHPNEK